MPDARRLMLELPLSVLGKAIPTRFHTGIHDVGDIVPADVIEIAARNRHAFSLKAHSCESKVGMVESVSFLGFMFQRPNFI